ncbi:unnamed protein product [Heligmosomoides polygyrus]|uniref:Fork-head domain-containing protein n=1 Tax=Heligmosomoides polygyrus TaxID=6339 RepID=A0A3P7ZNY8_HELPZ|nr:unnamed protein product [Heligmosomoides polygyrus]
MMGNIDFARKLATAPDKTFAMHGQDSLDGFDSLANSPLSHLTAESESSSPSSFGCSVSSLNLDCDVSLPTFSYDELPSPLLGFPDPAAPALSIAGESFEMTAVPARRPTMVRKRTHECSMVCWLFRTLLTSEYRALPLNAIFEIFEDTPRKDFLVMNEAGSWWTVHPDCEAACADEVFRPGLAHRCPPNGGGSASRMKMYQVDDTSEIIYRDSNRGKWANDRIYARRRPQERPKKQSMPLRPSSISLFSMKPASQFPIRHTAHVNPHRGDHLVVDHEEEVR